MDQATKHTALFFGFVAAAMTQVSAQQAAAAERLQTPPAVERSIGDGGSPAVSAAKRAPKTVRSERGNAGGATRS